MAATIEEDLYSFLAAIPAVTTASAVVEKGRISATQGNTRVYFQRDETTHDLLLAGTAGMTEDIFSVEVGTQSQATTRTIVDGIVAALNGWPANGNTGTFPNNTVLGVFVSDQADDYEYKGFKADEGFYLAAVQVQILR